MESWLFCKHKWELWLLVAVLAVSSVGAQDNLQCVTGINTPGGKLVCSLPYLFVLIIN